MLEARLKTLFDYQRFERNERLQAVISDTMDRCARTQPVSVPDEALAMAAGGLGALESRDRQEPGHDRY